jgi:hypothetical protein
MFNLNSEITKWRRTMAKSGDFKSDELDEFQSHLVEAFEVFVKDGVAPPDAFKQASEQLGNPVALASEYDKMRDLNPRKLWVAFLVAPIVAPVLFALIVLIVLSVGLMFSDPKDPGTPIGVVMVPVLSLILGVIVSYFVAGVIWMPLIVFLKNRGLLSGRVIHVAAFVLAILLYGLLELSIYAITAVPRPDLLSFIRSSLFIGAMFIPCVMLSATTFWWMLRNRNVQTC